MNTFATKIASATDPIEWFCSRQRMTTAVELLRDISIHHQGVHQRPRKQMISATTSDSIAIVGGLFPIGDY